MSTKKATKKTVKTTGLKELSTKEVKKRNKIDIETKQKAFSYFAKGLTCKEISKLIGIPFRTIQNWQTVDKWNDKLNPLNIQNRCFELKKKGNTIKEIANLLNISVSSVQRYIKSAKEAQKESQPEK